MFGRSLTGRPLRGRPLSGYGLSEHHRIGGAAGAFRLLSLSPHLLTLHRPPYLYTDEAHTTLIASDGETAGAVLNLGTDGGYLTQATAGNEPIYNTSSGLHWLTATGAGDNKYLTGSFALTGTDLYVAAAFMPTAAGDAFCRLVSCSDIGENDFGSTTNAIPVLRNDTNAAFGGFCNGGVLATGSISNSTAYVVESIFTSGSHTFSVNGSDASAASAHNLNCSSVRLFASIEAAGPGAFLAGRCYNLFMRRGTPPSSAQRAHIRTALGADAGLVL